MSEEKQNLSQQELLWKIYENTEKMRKYILWKRIISWLKVVIIIVIIILGTIYLPSLIEKTIQPYKGLLEMNNQGQNILEQLKKESGLNLIHSFLHF